MGFLGGTQKPAPVEAEIVEELPQPATQSNTIFAEGIHLKGSIHGEGAVQIEGAVKGEIALDGILAVSPSGVVTGPITAGIVRIAGTTKGDIEAREQLWLNATGSIEGDIKTPSLVVEDGGVLNGRATMERKKEPPRPIHGGPKLSELQFGSNYNPEDTSAV